MEYQPLIWLGFVILFVIIEAISYQLASIWFAIGAVFALIVSVFTDHLLLQASVFVVVSGICLLTLRPLAKKYLKPRVEHTNADRSIGKKGIVLVQIDNDLGKGQVNIAGQIWSARSSDNQIIQAGDEVEVEKIEGVKLIVSSK